MLWAQRNPTTQKIVETSEFQAPYKACLFPTPQDPQQSVRILSPSHSLLPFPGYGALAYPGPQLKGCLKKETWGCSGEPGLVGAPQKVTQDKWLPHGNLTQCLVPTCT